MIRVNLLAVERKASKKATPFLFAQKITIGCSVILIAAVLFIGWRYWTVQQESAQLDKDITSAQQETTRLHSLIQQVQQFEQRKAQLQQRVLLIEQLRKSQTGPVHMLDQISRALPPMVWLTDLKQIDDSVQIDGKCTGLTSLSDFVSSLESSGYFKRSIEILSSQTEVLPTPPGELVKFSIKAQFQPPAEQVASR